MNNLIKSEHLKRKHLRIQYFPRWPMLRNPKNFGKSMELNIDKNYLLAIKNKYFIKQYLKLYYGSLSEKKIRNLILSFKKLQKSTVLLLLSYLERRLDRVLVRAQFARSIFHARQLITHRAILVNKQSQINSNFLLKKDDIIQVKFNKTKNIINFLNEKKKSGFIHNNFMIFVDYKYLTFIFNPDLEYSTIRCFENLYFFPYIGYTDDFKGNKVKHIYKTKKIALLILDLGNINSLYK